MDADSIGTERLLLAPLVTGDAEELVEVLADPGLHQFIGGHPATLDELRARYAAMTAGSGVPDELWRNWVVRRRADGQAVGTVQATLYRRRERWSADIAWVIGLSYQGRGYAAEAARALVAWLAGHDVEEVIAHIHPDHAASAGVARRAGLEPTDERVDGEVVWRALTAAPEPSAGASLRAPRAPAGRPGRHGWPRARPRTRPPGGAPP